MDERPVPTLAAARARVAAVRPGDYVLTRNQVGGAVSGLSPYITHGFVTLPEVLAGVDAAVGGAGLVVQHKFVYELGWRAYFRHVWQHRGDGIFTSLHDGPLPDEAYATQLPDDIREGRSGVPVVDAAVRVLYATGTLHNHARMWLASYAVHLRKVHWRVGADWLYGHLLDGDLASNHLSWQWVAGTASHQPYVFNADNVARHAPISWHSPGSVIDTSYEALGEIARRPARLSNRVAVARGTPLCEPLVRTDPPNALGTSTPDAAHVAGRDVWLVHPWNLGALPDDLPVDTVVVGLFLSDFHRAWPWNESRWHFVGQRMAQLTTTRWHGDAAAVGAALAGARGVRSIDEPHLAPWLARWTTCLCAPTLFPAVDRRCDSFSAWWTRVTRGRVAATELLRHPGHPVQPLPESTS